MARGTTGAPRHDQTAGAENQERQGGRLIRFVTGRKTKFVVVAFWLVLVAVTGSLAGKLPGAEKNDVSSAESVQELSEQDRFQSQNLNPALVVYLRPSGITADDMRKARADARLFAALPAVQGRIVPPAESKIFKAIDSTLLYATLGVVIGLLLLTCRSPVLWLLPIISAGVALTAAEAVIYLLTQHASLTVNGQSEGILVVLVIGASTDYALLLIARYREELRRHADRHAAMAVALRRAGPAIIASGLTVVAGTLCLLAAEPDDISGLGPVAAIGIAVGLIATVTLLPALLVVSGRWRPALTLDIGRHIWWPSSLSRTAAMARTGTPST